MKKIFSAFMIAVCCMFMAMPAQAQLLKWGVKGGVNMTKIDWDGGYKGNKDNSTGFFIGPMAEFTIPIVGLGIDGALLFSQRGKGNVKQTGAEVPVNLKYTIGLGSLLGIYVAAGPDFFFDFKKKDYVDRKKAQVALNLGAGVKLLKHLQVGVTYQLPMGDSFTWEEAGKAFGAKNKTWQVSAAYLF
ncbi:porin family protein [Bacteroides rodentium]